MKRAEQARRFLALHVPGDPLILFNIWDPGSARAVADAGAAAIATGSWSVAAAFGHRDGEDLPRALAVANLERIARAVDLPVTVDFEGGYGEEPEAVAETARLAIGAGAIGCNFEDRVVGGEGLHPLERQQERIAAMHAAAGDLPFFINARTDLFLLADRAEHAASLEPAMERAHAYAEAGASGLFVPGLADAELIERVCARSPLPVNVMVVPGLPPRARLAGLGVARISHGAGPYRRTMRHLTSLAKEAFTDD